MSGKKLDKNKLIACCVLHDILNHENNHASVGAEYAKKYLQKKKFSKKFIDSVYEGIFYHSDKPKVDDFTIACFYDSDILCRFYALGVLRAWNNIKFDKNRDWKNFFKEVSKEENLRNYVMAMKNKLQVNSSKKILETKVEEYISAHKFIAGLIN